jgi:hypothetical protein
MSEHNFLSDPKYFTAQELLELLPEAPIVPDHTTLGTTERLLLDVLLLLLGS